MKLNFFIIKLENGLKKHVRNVARIKHGFVELVVILFTLNAVETGLGRLTLLVVVIRFDTYPFLAFLNLTCCLDDTGIGVFWLHCAA